MKKETLMINEYRIKSKLSNRIRWYNNNSKLILIYKLKDEFMELDMTNNMIKFLILIIHNFKLNIIDQILRTIMSKCHLLI